MTLTFIVSRVIIPDPARAWAGAHAGPQTLAALTTRFHLKDPIYVQFYYYLSDLFHGDWGVSPSSGQPVLYSIILYLPATIELAFSSMLIIIFIGIPLGVIAATHRNKIEDHWRELPPYLE